MSDLDFVREVVWEGGVVGLISSHESVAITSVPEPLRAAFQGLAAAYDEWESAWYESGINELVSVVLDEQE